ncbi:hypothetical protein [Alteromonas macleodii]|nr:hypothetical protein [Alteromonas macleodii]
MNTTFKRFYPSTFAPFLMAWVLSYLVVSTGFQPPDVANSAEVTSQSPLAKFVHNSQSYSLRFNASKLTDNNSEQPTDADLLGLIPASLHSVYTGLFAINTRSADVPLQSQKWVKPSPRAPPSILI